MSSFGNSYSYITNFFVRSDSVIDADIVSSSPRSPMDIENSIDGTSDPVKNPDSKFKHNVEVGSARPRAEQLRLHVARPDFDIVDLSDGISLGGLYQPVLRDIEIFGDNLSNSQKQVILNSISVVADSQPSSLNGDLNSDFPEDLFEFNITSISNAGAPNFTVSIPYRENVAINNSSNIDIPFLDIVADQSNPNPISLTVSDSSLSINAGSETSTESMLQFFPADTNRDISGTVTKTDSAIDIEYQEDISNQPIIVVDSNISDTYPNWLQNNNIVSFDIKYNFMWDTGSDQSFLEVSHQIQKEDSGGQSLSDVDFMQVKVAPACELFIEIESTFAGQTLLMNKLSYSLTVEPKSVFGSNLRQIPAINIVNNHEFNAPFFIDITNSGISIRGTKDSVATPAEIILNIDSNTKIDEAVNAIKQAISSEVPEWLSWLDVSVFSGEVNGFDVGNMMNNTLWSGLVNINNIKIEKNDNFNILHEVPESSLINGTVQNSEDFDFLINQMKNDFLGFPFEIEFNAPDVWKTLPIKVLKDNTYIISKVVSVDALTIPQFASEQIIAGERSLDLSITYQRSSGDTVKNLIDAINAASVGSLLESTASSLSYENELLSDAFLGYNQDDVLEVRSMIDSPSFLRLIGKQGTLLPTRNENFLIQDVNIAEISANIEQSLSGIIGVNFLLPSLKFSPVSDLINGVFDFSVQEFAAIDISFNVIIENEYLFNNFSSLDQLASRIELDWIEHEISVNVRPETDSRPDASLENILPTSSSDIRANLTIIPGSVQDVFIIEKPNQVIEFDFNIPFAVNNILNEDAGIQVALGGSESNGVRSLKNAPNNWQEPRVTTPFDIDINVVEADIVYLLLRTRQDIINTQFQSQLQGETEYRIRARYSNGASTEMPIVEREIGNEFAQAWSTNEIGIPPIEQSPVSVAIPVKKSNEIEVEVEDLASNISLSLTINNQPSELDQCGFLAINRSSLSTPQVESRVGQTFGLVLDAIGSWDILLSPEAILRTPGNEILYSNIGFDRSIIDSNESYNMIIANISNIPEEVRQDISLSPVPGKPEVWVLQIGAGIKRFLKSQREDQDIESKVGCELDIDIFVSGQESGATGFFRCTVIHDIYCVTDLATCDIIWNLREPAEDNFAPPNTIEENISFEFDTLVDCSNLEKVGNQLDTPSLLIVKDIPTFENGNALLVLKTFYSPEVQGFYFPTGADLQLLQFSNCSNLNTNISLASRLNRNALYLPEQSAVITDPTEIALRISSENSYLHVQPKFMSPTKDKNLDCRNDEIVLASIGFQFKNWRSGSRQESLLIGNNIFLSDGVFASPNVEICYRYYYNRKAT